MGYAGSVTMGTMLSESHYIGFGGFINLDIAYFVMKNGGLGKLELSTFNNFTYFY